MNALETLQKLRKAKNAKYNKTALENLVAEQSKQIVALMEEKKLLTDKLSALELGEPIEELTAAEEDDQQVCDAYNELWRLKELLADYRLLGPCGLTVKDADQSFLTVNFRPMWKSVTESYDLTLVAVDGAMQVSYTTIPSFIDVPAMARSMGNDVISLVDVVSSNLAAYVQRKEELDTVQETHRSMLTHFSSIEPVTDVALGLCIKDNNTEILKRLNLDIYYAAVDQYLPTNVHFSTENVRLPQDVKEELRQSLLSVPLSDAMMKVAESLHSCEPLMEHSFIESDFE